MNECYQFYTICHFIFRALWFTTFFIFLFISLSLVNTVAEGRICFHEIVVSMSLSLYKMSLLLLSETSERVSAYLHRILPSFRTLLCKTTIATEGNQARKQTGYPNQWSLCCSLMVLKIGDQEWSVCNFRPKHPASGCQ